MQNLIQGELEIVDYNPDIEAEKLTDPLFALPVNGETFEQFARREGWTQAQIGEAKMSYFPE